MKITESLICADIAAFKSIAETYKEFPEVEKALIAVQLILARTLVKVLEGETTQIIRTTIMNDDEIALLGAGWKIPAIKSLRERLYYGLAEAKKTIEDEGIKLGILVEPHKWAKAPVEMRHDLQVKYNQWGINSVDYVGKQKYSNY